MMIRLSTQPIDIFTTETQKYFLVLDYVTICKIFIFTIIGIELQLKNLIRASDNNETI